MDNFLWNLWSDQEKDLILPELWSTLKNTKGLVHLMFWGQLFSIFKSSKFGGLEKFSLIFHMHYAIFRSL